MRNTTCPTPDQLHDQAEAVSWYREIGYSTEALSDELARVWAPWSPSDVAWICRGELRLDDPATSSRTRPARDR